MKLRDILNEVEVKVDDFIRTLDHKGHLNRIKKYMALVGSSYAALDIKDRNKLDREMVDKLDQLADEVLRADKDEKSTVYPTKTLKQVLIAYVLHKYDKPKYE